MPVRFLSVMIEQNIVWIIGGLCAMCLILLILCIILFAKTRKRHAKLNMEEINADAIIEALENLDERIDALQLFAQSVQEEGEKTASEGDNSLCRIGIERYDAFPDCGGKQSYSIAILNKKNNGLLIRGIFTRDSNRTYFNQITDGNADIELSEEDKAAITKANS